MLEFFVVYGIIGLGFGIYDFFETVKYKLRMTFKMKIGNALIVGILWPLKVVFLVKKI